MGISISRLCERRAYRGRIDGEYRMRASSVASRSRTRGWQTATGPMPVMIARSGRWPWRTTRCWPVSVFRSLCFARNSATSASTAWVSSARAPLRRISVRESVKAPGWASLMTLLSDTAYHSFIGEVEALNTTTIRRLTRSRRHQLLAIARAKTLQAYLDVVEATLPQVLLIENVKGLTFNRKDEGLHLLDRELRRINAEHSTSYTPQVIAINAAHYGVPQLRERVFLFASIDGL